MSDKKDNSIHASIHKKDIDIGSEKKDDKPNAEKQKGGWIKKILDKKRENK